MCVGRELPFDKLRACPVLDAGANVLVKVPFDRLRACPVLDAGANVLAEAKAPFVLSLSKRLFGKFLSRSEGSPPVVPVN